MLGGNVIATTRNGLLDRLGKSSHGYVAGIETFPMPDLQRVAAELDLEAQGRARGERDEPKSDVSTFDSIERRVVQYVERVRDEADSQHREMQDAERSRLADLNFDALLGTLRSEAAKGVGAIHADVEKGKDMLAAARKDMLRAEAHLADYRSLHGLGNRTARYMRTFPQAFMRWAILAFLVLLESVANGLFFQQGSRMGLVGGVTIAAGFALLNVGLAFLAGRVLVPLLPRREPALRLFGKAGLAVYVLVAVGLNLMIAHYRSAFEVDAHHPSTIALQTIRSATISGLDVTSLTLLGIGLLFAVLAAFDAYTMGDSYLGYGGVTRDYERRRDTYAQDRAELIDDIRESYEGSVKAISELVEDFSRKRSEGVSIHKAIPRLTARLASHLNALERLGNDLLTIYREANASVRTTPAPAHFDQPWTLARPASVTAELPRYDEAEVEAILVEAKAELKEQTARLDLANAEATEILRSLDTLDERYDQ